MKAAKADKLTILMAIHHELCDAAELPENTRPYSVQSRLEEVEKLIMKEITNTPEPNPHDEIPF